MCKIDFDALKAEASMAHQSGRKMCMVHVDELVSLLVRAEELIKVQSMIPIRVGYCAAEELHKILRGELYRGGIQRKKKGRHTIEMLALWLPDGSKDAAQSFDLKSLIDAAV